VEPGVKRKEDFNDKYRMKKIETGEYERRQV